MHRMRERHEKTKRWRSTVKVVQSISPAAAAAQ